MISTFFITRGVKDQTRRTRAIYRSAPRYTCSLQGVLLLTDLRASLLDVVARDAEEVVGRRTRTQPPVLTRRLLWLRRFGCFDHHWRRQRGRVGHTGTRTRRHKSRQSRGDKVVPCPAHGAVLVRGVAAVGFAVAGFPLKWTGHIRSWKGQIPRARNIY